MTAGDVHPARPSGVSAHAVDIAFALVVIGWFGYALHLTRHYAFWADDLRLIEQAGTWGGLLEPYNNHMSLVILATYRALAEVAGLSYTPIVLAGALSLVAVPVSYFVTTRRFFGPPLAAILALPLLWHEGMELRPAELNHFMVLVGGILCATALNRGRRSDVVLAVALTFALCSAGGGVVVAGACLLHNALVRPPLRRWLAVLAPSALWAAWWLLAARDSSLRAALPVRDGQAPQIVWDLCVAPFYAAGLGNRAAAYLLMAVFAGWGAIQLRHGLAAAANFVVWSGAMVAWAAALVQSRGQFADPQAFRYTYLSLGFALLAIVPRTPIAWPAAVSFRRPLVVAMAAVVLVLGGLRGLGVRSELEEAADRNAARGRETTGTMLVLGLGPEVIPDERPIGFFGIFSTGTARQVRTIIDRYGSPGDATVETADQELADLGIIGARVGPTEDHHGCAALAAPTTRPGSGPTGPPVRLWAATSYPVEVRRYGDEWIRLVDAPAGRTVSLALPSLHTDQPWEIRAQGACDITVGGEGS